MARPITSGTYTVPKEVSALKPKEISCDIKVIVTNSKSSGSHKHYYVYESARTGTGKTIGKIEGGKFCPNARGRQLLGVKYDDAKDTESGKKNAEIVLESKAESDSLSEKVPETVKEAAVNLNVNIDEIALQIKTYGEYAIVLASTKDVLKKLEERFSAFDSKLIYALSIICFVQQYIPASCVKDVYDASILSNKWPTLDISENDVVSFLKVLGQHPATCAFYSQDLIDESSGLTVIDGHVILTCSKQNDLADYGNKYQKIENEQMSVLQAYDAINKVPLTSTVYDGNVIDKIAVQDLLQSFHFPEKTTFIIDMGFYSEEDLGLYREGGKYFVIPVPENTLISKALRFSITFTDSFIYKRVDENGLDHEDVILYRESTVRELEDLYQTFLDAEADRMDRKAEAGCKEGATPEKAPRNKVTHSAYGEDRVIMFRDEDIHARMVAEYTSEIGTDKSHTEEQLAEVGPTLGLIIMRTNRPKETISASTIFNDYKMRWRTETHYNFVENTIQFSGLKSSDYYAMQGLSFLMAPIGQIQASFSKQMAKASPYVKSMSIRECLIKAGCFKLVQHLDKKWRISMAPQKGVELLHEMGVDVAKDIKALNMSQL
ncbi:MAG: transposase [Clostridia bacterium]|nr:transposase [Clostridia bacterium]